MAAALLALADANAAPLDSVFLEDYTWPELREAVAAGKTTVLLPIGGTEQNGPHMALGKHNVRVRLLAERIARTLGDAVVAPVIAYVPEGEPGSAQGHMRFPGTLSAPREAFERTLEYAARSLGASGFHAIVLLGDHGGYQASLERVAERMKHPPAGGRARVIACVEYYRASQDSFAKILGERGFRQAEIGVHAGLADTALMLALDPALVRTDRLSAGDGARSTGVDGDPRRATADLGRVGVDLIVSRTVAAIRGALAVRP